jgi:hypothetical protein
LIEAGHTDAYSLADLKALGATPAILSLEDASTAEITKLLSDTQADAVLFSAGAGGKGAPERTRLVDYDGALKVRVLRRVVEDSLTPPGL